MFLLASAGRAQGIGAKTGAGQREDAGNKEPKAQAVNGKGAASRAPSSGDAQPSTESPDFKVVIWYRQNDPLGTFKYEVYDVRKGEYTSAVDAWVQNIEKRYTAYFVVVRGVDLKRERGETEQLKVGSVIQRELTVAAALAGVFVGGGPPTGFGFGTTQGLSRASGRAEMRTPNRPLGAAGIDRSYLNPLPIPFPVPIPYPRPHP
jgi:hypothetical protein